MWNGCRWSSKFGWAVLTKDEMIGRRVAEQAVIAQCNARVFVMASTGINTQAVTEGFVKAYQAMLHLASECDRAVHRQSL